MPRQVTIQLATDDNDVFQTAGSQLRRAPGNGMYQFWYGSDQADGQLSCKLSGLEVIEPSEMRVITANQLSLDRKPDAWFLCQEGQDCIVKYDEVAAGTATLHAKWLSLADVMIEQGHSPARIIQEQRSGIR